MLYATWQLSGVHKTVLVVLQASNSHKGPYEFEKIEHVQELKNGQHDGPIWCMKFSICGRLLATAGQDKILRIWMVKDAYPFFQVCFFLLVDHHVTF